MKKIIFILILIAAVFAVLIAVASKKSDHVGPPKEREPRTWQIKSIDTMKYSRDLSLEKINDPTFDQTINSQIKKMKETSATHAAIGTPYDEKFLPILKRWVKAARQHKLNVWYRGNFSGWQGWFGESKNLSREAHIELTKSFIKNNPDLFENGDVFSPCPECENGGPGDPRLNGDIDGHRKFLIKERNAVLEEFNQIGKEILVLDSMNYDVAKLVMDRATASAMGGVIVIDHYVKTPERLERDIQKLAGDTGAKIVLGEFGAPIPDIHGNFSDQQQAEWIEKALNLLQDEKDLIGLNYWVGFGGSTAIFNQDNTSLPAADILKKYFILLHTE